MPIQSTRSLITPEVSPVVSRRAEILAPAFLIAAACLSTAVWILMDQRVWPWDQAMYGTATLQLWELWRRGASAWFAAMLHALGSNPPLGVWLGQVFVPLRHVTGEFESAMLMANVLAEAGTLWLIYLTSRRLGAGLLPGLAAILTCAGSQTFIYLSSQYLMEAVECCAAAFMLFVAWHAEKRSLTRTLSLTVAAVGLSLLSKASSVIFVLPALTYVLMTFLVMRGRARPKTTPSDVLIGFAAVAIAGAAATWYAVNWSSMAAHFAASTVTKNTLYWGSPVYLPRKLAYWTQASADALSPFRALSAFLAVLVAPAIAVALIRSFRKNGGGWLAAMVEDGTLFALALAGTIVAAILAFSLQINEDPRFLLPLVPSFSVLVAWTLATLRARLLSVFVLAVLAANTLITRGDAHGGRPYALFAQYPGLVHRPWPLPVETSRRNKILLTEAVHLSCRSPGQLNFIATEYPFLNQNSAYFYMEKEFRPRGFRCGYLGYGGYRIFPTDVPRALEIINSVAPMEVLTVAADKQPPPDVFNVVTRALAEHLAHDPDYELVPGSGDDILIYRRVGAAR